MRHAAVIVVFGSLLQSARAHEFELNEDDVRALERAVGYLDREVDAASAMQLAPILNALSKEARAHLGSADAYQELSELRKRRLMRFLAVVDFATRFEGAAKDVWSVAVLLTSDSSRDQHEAIRALMREPFHDASPRMIADLALSPKPIVRMGAGKLAKIYSVFERPNPACRAVGLRLLVDPVPSVAGVFGTFDAHEFEDDEITTLMVARLTDGRPFPASPGIAPWPSTVADSLRSRLVGELYNRYQSVPIGRDFTAREIRAWWRENGDLYEYGPDPRTWHRVGAWIGEVALEQEVTVGEGERAVRFALLEYGENLRGGRPLCTTKVRVRPSHVALQDAAIVARLDAEVATAGVTESRIDGLGWCTEYIVVPLRTGRYRCRVRIWHTRAQRTR